MQSESGKIISMDNPMEDRVMRLEQENALLRNVMKVSFEGSARVAVSKVEESQWPFPFRTIKKVFKHTILGASEQNLSFESTADTRYSHHDALFKNTLHVCCQSWLGIRAAVGSLPGRKLALQGDIELSEQEIKTVLAFIAKENISRVVFHGFFKSADALIKSLAKAGAANMVHLVYHGNVAQWGDRTERSYALDSIAYADAGFIKKLHFMRRDYPLAGKRSFRPMLLNLTPRNQINSREHREAGTVIIPGADSWRKNIHANAFGAALCETVQNVLVYAEDIKLPPRFAAKLKNGNFVDRNGTLELMSRVACTLNVSHVECHPMVGLESEAVGTPCLRGPLHLDFGEDHPYVKLVEVKDPISPFEISDKLTTLLGVPCDERISLVAEYSSIMNTKALQRYKEFLEL